MYRVGEKQMQQYAHYGMTFFQHRQKKIDVTFNVQYFRYERICFFLDLQNYPHQETHTLLSKKLIFTCWNCSNVYKKWGLQKIRFNLASFDWEKWNLETWALFTTTSEIQPMLWASAGPLCYKCCKRALQHICSNLGVRRAIVGTSLGGPDSVPAPAGVGLRWAVGEDGGREWGGGIFGWRRVEWEADQAQKRGRDWQQKHTLDPNLHFWVL